MITIADWIVAAGTVVMAVVAVVAVFQDKIRAWLTRPKLDVSISVSPPDCHKIPIVRYGPEGEQSVIADGYYFRLRVTNSGNQRAELVEVFAAELSKRQADGTFKAVDSFLPMNLVWSHYHQVLFPAVSPEMYRHCDLAHVIHPQKRGQFPAEDNRWPNIPPEKTVLSLDTAVKPHTLSHLLPFGTYRLVVLIAAANAKPVKKILEISLTGDWYDDERKMLGEGIGIRLL